MATPEQQLFKKIVLHNKLLEETALDALLRQIPEPERAIQHLVKIGDLTPGRAGALMGLYQKQVERHVGHSDIAMPSTAAPAPPANDSFASAMEDILGVAAPAPPHAPPPKPTSAPAAPAPAASQPTPPPAPAKPAAAPPRVEVVESHEPRQFDPTIVRILQKARAVQASDVHIKSAQTPLMRLAGRLTEVPDEPPLSPEQAESGLLTLLTPAQREHFLRTGDLDFCFDGGEALGRYRSNFMRQFRGMDGIFRLISTKMPSFRELNLPPEVQRFTEYKQGIVLVTGPKGSGKTTTLAAMIDLINSERAEHIITIEDPIEFVHPCKKGHVNQREVGPHTNTFSAALRAALREAPDVIMVGEMRDLETTSLAITAAETGHLVFATLHTPDAIRTIDRVLDVFPPKEQGQIRSMISESMRGIVSQLLVPSKDGKSLHLAVEILVNTTAIGNLIRGEKTYQLRGVMQTGRKLGMQLMDTSLANLVREGKVAKEEALTLAIERERMMEELKGY